MEASRNRPHAGWIVGVVLWIAAPVAALIILTLGASSTQLSGSPSPTWIPVRVSASATTSPIDLALLWNPAEDLIAPNWNGIVQEVGSTAGQKLADDDLICTIDGIKRVAALTPGPFYRPIAPGDSGADVGWLNTFLGDSGFTHGNGTESTSNTAAGVKQLAASLGAPVTTTFDPAWVVFVPRADFVVSSTSLTIGAPAPAAGTSILKSTARLQSATIVPLGTFDGLIAAQTDGTPAILSPQAVAAQATSVSSKGRITIGTESLELNASRTAIAAASLHDVGSSVAANDPILQATLERPTEQGDSIIPSASVFSSSRGKSCIRTRNANTSPRTIAVQVVSDQDGNLVVHGQISAGSYVEVAVPNEDRSCT